MKTKFLVLAFLAVLAARPAAAEPQPQDYRAAPFWLEGGTIPQVMLVLERDWKMYYPAYNNLADLDGDGGIDIGFNPEVTYVGYFDSDSCYVYDGAKFIRLGPARAQTASELAALIPEAIKNVSAPDSGSQGLMVRGIKTPLSRHGVCDRSKAAVDGGSTGLGGGQWHGNWMNFSTTGRMDAIRRALYGGKRYVDTPTSTVLELIPYLPPNGHNWGGELFADDRWEEYAKSSPWYDIPSFTGYTRPTPGRAHFWARSSHYRERWNSAAYTRAREPLFQFAANVPLSNWHKVYKTPVRIWDWVGDHAGGSAEAGYANGMPQDKNIATPNADFATMGYANKPANQAARRYIARVEACRPGSIGPNENCRAYGSNSKPVGLLQEYGESGKMLFGLLTGSLHTATRWQGGVARHHIQPFSAYVNFSDGTIKRPGLIDTVDRLQITGIGGFTYNANDGRSETGYTDGTQAGNPLGEMVYEATRYLLRRANARKTGLAPTPEYQPADEVALPAYDRGGYYETNYRSKLPRLTAWDAGSGPARPYLGRADDDCAKPIILVLSEVYPDHDADGAAYPALLQSNHTNAFTNSFPNAGELASMPRLSWLTGASPPQAFDVRAYLRLITNQERLATSYDGKLFFYPDKPRGVCKPANLGDTGLADLNGHCPSEPSLQGSYSVAAVAYYAHTHDITNLGGASIAGAHRERFIDLYAVGIPGNFPDITMTVDQNRSITLMPLAVSTDNPEKSLLRTLINFYVESWETDGTAGRRPIKIKFGVNFEYTTTPAWASGSGSNNMERDIFDRFEITILTDRTTPAEYRERMPVFINSGALKTCPYGAARATDPAVAGTAVTNDACMDHWYAVKAAYRGGDLAAFENDTAIEPVSGAAYRDRYYYAFKNPNPRSGTTPLDITKYSIAGVSVQNYTHGSFINMEGHGGYAISGVEHPGAYLDAGYHGSDNQITANNNTTPFNNQQVVITADYPDPRLHTPYPGSAARGLPPGHRNPAFNDIQNNSNAGPSLITPWECPFSGYTDNNRGDADVLRAYGPLPTGYAARACGSGAIGAAAAVTGAAGNWFPNHSLMRYIQARSFKFDEHAPPIAKLPNPLWLAAKYGGFKGRNPAPTDSGATDWKRGGAGPDKDDPYNYYGVANISDLPKQLGQAFEDIANSVSTGTANAASINVVLGGGLSIQTQYYTEYVDPHDSDNKIGWLGSVYALFVDKWGNLRADTNGDKRLQLITSKKGDPGPEKGDLIVHTVTLPNDEKSTLRVYLCRDPYGNNNGSFQSLPDDRPPDSTYPPDSDCQPVAAPSGSSSAMEAAPMVWHAAAELAKKNPADRKLYTYYGDAAGDGLAAWPSGDRDVTQYPFSAANAAQTAKLRPLLRQPDAASAADLINYIRGQEFPKYRNRTTTLPWNGTRGVWRLGDVINSRPVIVGGPSANYNLLYRDESYAQFRDARARRRQVVYFGSNDGVLHAVNLGFFGSLKTGEAGYSPAEDPAATSGRYAFGEEMWGYLPTAALPHLAWLADKKYRHNYFVDLAPHIVDIKDGADWRTVMLVGLRLGGRTIALDETSTPPKYSYSEVFALDITDPENPPKLMWRYSSPQLGLPAAEPSVARNGNDWYVVLPSGPTSDNFGTAPPSPDPVNGPQAYEGRSSQKARVIVLNALTGQYARGRDRNPGSDPAPDPLVAPEERSFFNSGYMPRAANVNRDANGNALSWSHHVVYLGMTAQDADARDVGAVYRLQMASETTGDPLPVGSWKLARFYKTDKPVTGAPNSTYDSRGDLWVVFGTGRIWYNQDQAPCGSGKARADRVPGSALDKCCANHEQYFHGLKEPLLALPGPDDREIMTFAEVGLAGDKPILDVSGISVYGNGRGDGLLLPETNATGETLYSALYLNKMIAKDNSGAPVIRGYKKMMESWKIFKDPDPGATRFEIITTQPQIDGMGNGRSNTVFTSYLTNDNLCDPKGDSYLNVLDTFTGLPHPDFVEYQGFYQAQASVGGATLDQATGVKKSGKGMATGAVIAKTGEGTFYGNNGFNGNKYSVSAPLALSDRSAVISWREVLDMGFEIQPESLYKDLK